MRLRVAVFAFCIVAVCQSVLTSAVARADGPSPPPDLQPLPYVHLFPTLGGVQANRAAAPSAPLPLAYHFGPVQRVPTAYLIFWDPNNQLTASYKSLIARYFKDVSGSPFYNITTQYFQRTGPLGLDQQFMRNQVVLGGSFTDRTAYPHAGTGADPLTLTDIYQAIIRDMHRNGWQDGASSTFFVLTAPGIESCVLSVSCTPGTAHPTYCAYHAFLPYWDETVVFADIPFQDTWPGSCRGFDTSPNANIDADATISVLSHEHFEAATDPLLGGWWDWNAGIEEIADKCAYNYGDIGAGGANLTLNGNPYVLQLEWSNARSACVKSGP